MGRVDQGGDLSSGLLEQAGASVASLRCPRGSFKDVGRGLGFLQCHKSEAQKVSGSRKKLGLHGFYHSRDIALLSFSPTHANEGRRCYWEGLFCLCQECGWFVEAS